MVQNVLVKILLAPFSLLYGIGISLRNFFYRKGLLKGMEFNLPVISIGNLSIGGTGKTPHIEYLIRLLKDYINVATLSRGYQRKTKGFLEVQPNFSAEQSGDEPLQFARKFRDILVTVGEDRSFAIPKIVQNHPGTQAILLDDAFQHLSVKPGLNIMLTDYNRMFTRDYLLPSGRLREWRSSYQRADVIIVSKCPKNLSEEERDKILEEIKPFPHQQVFFSYYEYGNPYYMFNPQQRFGLQEDWDVIVICAIAGTDYLLDYLNSRVNSVKALEFEDHHYFTKYDLGKLEQGFSNLPSDKKVIITTEKDAMRLELHREFLLQKKLPILSLPVEVAFLFGEGPKFDGLVKDYLLGFKV
jgi:tetraacyldisaccharide 4'-kinase